MNINYSEYLNSDQWKRKRKLVMERSNGVCEGCGVYKANQVHHLSYRRLGNEMLFDLVALCRSCHMAIHNVQA